jgi:hypothetical protein
MNKPKDSNVEGEGNEDKEKVGPKRIRENAWAQVRLTKVEECGCLVPKDIGLGTKQSPICAPCTSHIQTLLATRRATAPDDATGVDNL